MDILQPDLCLELILLNLLRPVKKISFCNHFSLAYSYQKFDFVFLPKNTHAARMSIITQDR